MEKIRIVSVLWHNETSLHDNFTLHPKVHGVWSKLLIIVRRERLILAGLLIEMPWGAGFELETPEKSIQT